MSAFDQPWSWALPKQQQAALIQGAGAVSPGILQKQKDRSLENQLMATGMPYAEKMFKGAFDNLSKIPGLTGAAAERANAEMADLAGGMGGGLGGELASDSIPAMTPDVGRVMVDPASAGIFMGTATPSVFDAATSAAPEALDAAGLTALDSAASAGADAAGAAAGAAMPGAGTLISAGSDVAQGDYLKGGVKLGGTIALSAMGVPPPLAGTIVSLGTSILGLEDGTTGVPMNRTGIPQQFEEGTMGASPKAITLDYGDKVINIKNKTAPESLQNSLSKESVAAALAARVPGPLNAGRPQPPASVLEKFGRMATGNDGMLGQAKQALHQGSQRAMQYADGTMGAQGQGKSPQSQGQSSQQPMQPQAGGSGFGGWQPNPTPSTQAQPGGQQGQGKSPQSQGQGGGGQAMQPQAGGSGFGGWQPNPTPNTQAQPGGQQGQGKSPQSQGQGRGGQAMSQPRMYADGTTGAQGGKSPQGGQQPVPQPLPQQNGGGEQAGGKGAQGGGGVPPQMAALAAQQRGGGGAFGQIAMPQAGSAGGVKPITATNYYGELTATPAASNPATTGARTDATTIVPIPKTEKKKKDTAATAATDLDLYNRIKMVQTANGTNGAPPVAPPPNPDYGKKKPLKEWTPLDDAWYKYEQDWANYNRT